MSGDMSFLKESLQSRAVCAIEIKEQLIKLTTDEAGYEKVTLADVDTHFGILESWVVAGKGSLQPVPPMHLRAMLTEVDENFSNRLSGTERKMLKDAWARAEADRLHLLMSYLNRLARRSTFSKSASVLRLKLLAASYQEDQTNPPLCDNSVAIDNSHRLLDILPDLPKPMSQDCETTEQSQASRH